VTLSSPYQPDHLGVADSRQGHVLLRAVGFVRSKSASADSVSFFQAGPVVLALWGRDAQRDERKPRLWTGNGGIVVAQNLASEDAVDVAMARAEAAGARILKPAAKTFGAAITAISPTLTDMCGKSPSTPSGNSMKDGRV
jgi:4-hydroxyphenylpyruvate dioxygenase-like putative hemolysin